MAVDEDDSLGDLAAPDQALAYRDGRVVLVDVCLEVAMAGFAEKDAIPLKAEELERAVS